MNASDKISRDERRQLHRLHHKNSGARFSILLIVVGLLFLAVNTGLIPTMYKNLFGSWPIWLVFGGVFFLFERNLFIGLTMLTVGTFYIIPQIGDLNPALNIPENFAHLYWPALLVVAGLYLFLSKTCHSKYCGNWGYVYTHFDKHNTTVNNEDGFLQVSTVFDSRKNIVVDPIFKGGNVDCTFGELELDLRKTTLAEGKTILNVSCSFGSILVIVPSDWNVQLQGNSAFGSFEDSRYSPTHNATSGSTLIIQGKCSFGEVKLRD